MVQSTCTSYSVQLQWVGPRLRVHALVLLLRVPTGCVVINARAQGPRFPITWIPSCLLCKANVKYIVVGQTMHQLHSGTLFGSSRLQSMYILHSI